MATTQKTRTTEYDITDSQIESLRILAEEGEHTSEIASNILRLVE